MCSLCALDQCTHLHNSFVLCTLLQAAGSEGSAAAALPVALWAEILQHVPQQQRLSQCAVVCSAWALAAAQATVHVVCEELQPDAVPALQAWIAMHAAQLLSLKLAVADYDKHTLQLPLNKLTKLQSLQLKGIILQLPGKGAIPGTSPGPGSSNSSSGGSCSGHAAAGPVLSSLQLLELDQVELADISSLMQLTKAPQLSSLKFKGLQLLEPAYPSQSFNGSSDTLISRVAGAVADMLGQLPRLSFLRLPELPISDAAMQQTAAMTQLQTLSFDHIEEMAPCDLQPLPSSITQLEIQGNIMFNMSPSLPPRLPQLSGLLELYLTYCAVPPTVLGDLTQLEVLYVKECRLAPIAPNHAYFQTEGTSALLDVLPRLARLRYLHLHVDGLDTDSIAPQRFSALTASSHLTRLVMARENNRSVAKGAVQHMFPPGRQMPLLQDLSISTDDSGTFFPIDDVWCMDDADIISIISACPQLGSLSIEKSIEPGTDLSVLLQLPGSAHH
jgi:hypothetical protein